MSPEITLRRALRGDAEAVAAVYVETWRDAYPGMLPDNVLTAMSTERQTSTWAETIAGRRGAELVLVAESTGGGIVGFASGGRSRPKDLVFDCEIYTLYLLPDFRGCGIGRALMDGMFRGFAHRGYQSAVVWVLAANPSRFFYEAMGGRLVAAKEENLWGRSVRQLAYGWPRFPARPVRSAS